MQAAVTDLKRAAVAMSASVSNCASAPESSRLNLRKALLWVRVGHLIARFVEVEPTKASASSRCAAEALLPVRRPAEEQRVPEGQQGLQRNRVHVPRHEPLVSTETQDIPPLAVAAAPRAEVGAQEGSSTRESTWSSMSGAE